MFEASFWKVCTYSINIFWCKTCVLILGLVLVYVVIKELATPSISPRMRHTYFYGSRCINNRKKNTQHCKTQKSHTFSVEFVYHGHPAAAFSTFCSNSSASGPTGSSTFIYRTQTTLNHFVYEYMIIWWWLRSSLVHSLITLTPNVAYYKRSRSRDQRDQYVKSSTNRQIIVVF